MSNFDFEGYSEGEWEDRGDLAWNEFDWERYLRSQEKVFGRYLRDFEEGRGIPLRGKIVAVSLMWISILYSISRLTVGAGTGDGVIADPDLIAVGAAVAVLDAVAAGLGGIAPGPALERPKQWIPRISRVSR